MIRPATSTTRDRKSRSGSAAGERTGPAFSLRPTARAVRAPRTDVKFPARCEMTKQSYGTKVGIGLAVGVLAGALSLSYARADEGMTQRTSPTTAERTTSQTFVVSGIDRSKRSVTLTNSDGERSTM